MKEDKKDKKIEVKVWDESCKTSSEEFKFYVRLINNAHHDIDIVVCDKQGNIQQNNPYLITMDFEYKIICIHSHIIDNFPLRKNYKEEPEVVTMDSFKQWYIDRMMKREFIKKVEDWNKEQQKEEQ